MFGEYLTKREIKGIVPKTWSTQKAVLLKPNPAVTSQKSFGGRAIVIEDTFCGLPAYWLQSYDTIVGLAFNDNFYRTWGGWSATTAKHVKSFIFTMLEKAAPCKKEWERLQVYSISELKNNLIWEGTYK